VLSKEKRYGTFVQLSVTRFQFGVLEASYISNFK